jgi:hypothetical protein
VVNYLCGAVHAGGQTSQQIATFPLYDRILEGDRHPISLGDEVLSARAVDGVTNPRLFGSVARGDANADSDLDLLVDLLPHAGNPLLRVVGMSQELSEVVGRRVDVVTTPLLHNQFGPLTDRLRQL